MSLEEELAELYLAIMAEHDLGRANDLFASDFAFHFGAAPPQQGVSAWSTMVGAWLEAFPDLEPIETDVIAAPGQGKFAVRMRWTATHLGDFNGIGATGCRVVNEGVSTFRMEGGRVAEEWIFEDIANLVEQITKDT